MLLDMWINCLYNYITEITGRILKPFCDMLVKLLIYNYCVEMLSCFATSILLALPCAGCDCGSMKIIQSSVSNVKPSATRSGISMWLSKQVPLRGSFQMMGFSASLWKVLLNYSWSSPEVKNKPQLKSPSLVAFEYEPLDFHQEKKTSMSAELFKAFFPAKKKPPGQYCTKRT